MPKKKTSFTLSEESLRLLKKLAEKNNRSQANMIEALIAEESKKASGRNHRPNP